MKVLISNWNQDRCILLQGLKKILKYLVRTYKKIDFIIYNERYHYSGSHSLVKICLTITYKSNRKEDFMTELFAFNKRRVAVP